MVFIGLTGTVAAGKTTVAGQLAAAGAEILVADRLGHEVLQLPAVCAALRDRWGDEVLDSRGQVDRPAVARRVFAAGPVGVEDRHFLESLTHPQILRRVEAELVRAARDRPAGVVVLEAALLCEASWDRACDLVLLVTAPEPVRRRRAVARGWTVAQFTARQAAQWPESAKRAAAHVVIDNGGNLTATAAQVGAFWARLTDGGIRAFLANGPSRGGQKPDNE